MQSINCNILNHKLYGTICNTVRLPVSASCNRGNCDKCPPSPRTPAQDTASPHRTRAPQHRFRGPDCALPPPPPPAGARWTAPPRTGCRRWGCSAAGSQGRRWSPAGTFCWEFLAEEGTGSWQIFEGSLGWFRCWCWRGKPVRRGEGVWNYWTVWIDWVITVLFQVLAILQLLK